MKRKAMMAMMIVAVALMIANPAAAWTNKNQATFTAPDGSVTQHNQFNEGHLLGVDQWTASVTSTPPPGLVVTRIDESYSRSTTAPVLDPKCNNFKYNLTTKVTENRKTTKYDQVQTKVVGTAAGSHPSLLNVAIPAFFYGVGGAAPYAFGGSGGSDIVNKVANDVNANAYGGDAKAYGGDASAVANADAKATATMKNSGNSSLKNNNHQGQGGGAPKINYHPNNNQNHGTIHNGNAYINCGKGKGHK